MDKTDTINAYDMTTEELRQKLEKGYNDIAEGRVQNAEEAFAKFRDKVIVTDVLYSASDIESRLKD